MGIENINSEILEENIGRAGFFSIESKEFGELGFLATKGADSTKNFTQISDYYLGGTDIGDKVQARGLKLDKIEEILGEILWGYKTELLLLLGRNTLGQVKDISSFEGNIIGEIDPKSQVGKIANGIQSEVNLALYKIIFDKNNKSQEFIKAIQNSMKNFNKN